MLFIVANGLAGGRRAGIAAALGAATGVLIQTVAAAAGVAAILQGAPRVYDAIRILGGVYLLWLAVSHLRSSGSKVSEHANAFRSARRVYVRAVANNLANPKVILFFVAFVPQFVDPTSRSAEAQFLLLGGIFLAVGLLLDITIGVLCGAIRDALGRNEWVARTIDRVAGGILAVLGVRILISADRP
jgi:threonine/homoserine/homoserine lactone efflux protein